MSEIQIYLNFLARELPHVPIRQIWDDFLIRLWFLVPIVFNQEIPPVVASHIFHLRGIIWKLIAVVCQIEHLIPYLLKLCFIESKLFEIFVKW